MSRLPAKCPDLRALQAELNREWSVLRSDIEGVLQRQFEKQEHLIARCCEGSEPNATAASTKFESCWQRAVVSSELDSAFDEPSHFPDISDEGGVKLHNARDPISSSTSKSIISKKSTSNKFGKPRACLGCVPLWATQRCKLCVQCDDGSGEPERAGFLAKLVDSAAFEMCTSLVILLNSAFMVYTTNYDIDHLNAEPTQLIFWTEFAFMVFYCIELFLKALVHRLYFFVGASMWWNWFDVLVVIVGLFSQVLTFATMGDRSSANLTFMRTTRILKLAKLSRTVRLMHQFAELRLILNSLLGSLANLGWSIAMLALIFYLFALVFVQLTASWLAAEMDGEADDASKLEVLRARLEPFGSVQNAMLSLYMSCTGGDDWTNFYTAIQNVGWVGTSMFVFFVAFMQIAVMNILTGVFVEQAMKLAPPDRDRMALEYTKAEIEEAEELRRMCHEMDINGDGTIRKEELCEYIEEGKLKSFLMTLGLNLKDADNFWSIIDRHHDDAIDIETFVMECMKLKGAATNFDLAYLTTQMGNLERKQQVLHREKMLALQSISKNVTTHKNGHSNLGASGGYLCWSVQRKPCMNGF